MGFYGNITNVNNSTFVFDKIYPNRVTMDEQGQNDGVFVGRYVLVDYDQDDDISLYTRLYSRFPLSPTIVDYFYFNQPEDGKWMDEQNRARYIDIPYYIYDAETEKYVVNPERLKSDYFHYIFNGEIIYTLDENTGIRTFYKCIGGSKVYGVNFEYAKFEKMEENSNEKDVYYTNFQIDREKYPKMGRGYDSTVWQKTFSVEEGEKYVMLAELNSVVPSFGLTIDAPTLNPMTPHFDADSTNVYYKLHVQPTWGFRIKPEEKQNMSDEQIIYEERVWNPDKNWNETIVNNYKGAIYYNRDGFQYDKHYVKTDQESSDVIKIEPTGKSGKLYNNAHGFGQIFKEEKPDILELSLKLPSIGNAISKMWDLVYGTGQTDQIGHDDHGEDQDQFLYRNTNVSWNDYGGLRLVREKTDSSGFEYDVNKVETLAGCINSVHDLMGMIISEENKNLDEALINRIYYGNYNKENPEYKGYYIKERTFEIIEEDPKEIEAILTDFNKQDYYYLDNQNYYLETTGYHSGNTYYPLIKGEHILEKPLYTEDYEPNKYHYLVGKDYILATEAIPYPNGNRQYYKISDEQGISNSTVNHKTLYFYPEANAEEYFNTFFKGSQTEDAVNNIKVGNGLFYKKENKLYPFRLQDNLKFADVITDVENNTATLYWCENYIIEMGLNPDTNQYEPQYDFEKHQEASITPLLMTEFKENTYYYYDQENNNYILLTDLNLVSNDKYYSVYKETKFSKIENDFYEPGLYYYAEGRNYLLANEKTKWHNTYYTIIAIPPTSDLFYEPNKYYYKKDPSILEYTLDTNFNMTEGRTYYFEGVDWYVFSDANGIVEPGTKWNGNISAEEAKELGIILGSRKEIYEWKELTGFARTLNTIHGLILKINNLFKFNDKITRDTTTVQGCINKINDIIRNFGKLVPGQIVIVDNYGRITSSPYTANQDVKAKRYNFNYEELEFNNSDIEIEVKEGQAEEGWLGITIEDNKDKLNIGFEHKYNPIEEQEVQNTNMNNVSDKFGIIKPVIDNTGHIIAIDKEIIQLPNGYKYIETDNGEPNKIEAQNSKDIFILKGDDSWLSSIASVIEDKAQIEFTHLYPNQTANTSAELDMNNISSDGITEEEKANKENKIVLESINLDETGHVTNKNFDTITLPYGYKYIKAEGEENNTITAEKTQDTFSLIGDKNEENNQWIKTSILTDSKVIKIEHNNPSNLEVRNLNNLTPNFGDSFTIEDWVFDSKGHQANVSTHSITLPKGSLTEKEERVTATESNAIANIEFKPETGTITLIRKDINDFKLKPIDSDISQTLNGEVIFTENLGEALYKLQSQLTILNGDSSIETSVDYKINQAITEINDVIFGFIEKNDNEKLDTLEEVVDWITNDVRIDGAVAMQESIIDIEKDLNIQGQDIKNLTSSLQEKAEDLKQINNEVLPALTQEDINLHSRCNTLDKEVKNLINLTAPYEEKIKYLDEKIKYLEDKIKALTSE